MTKTEIEEVNKLAKANGGDLGLAARSFLGLPAEGGDNSAAAVNGVVDEVTQWNEADAETRAGIDAYKGAKDTVAESAAASGGKKSNGKSQAKSK